MTRGRFPWGLTVASAVLFAGLVSLGVWQVQRLQWKQGLIAQAEAAAARPPIALPDFKLGAVCSPSDNPAPEPAGVLCGPVQRPNWRYDEFQRIVLDCDWERGRVVDVVSIHQGAAGFRLITACSGFLVDLGFVPEGVAARPGTDNRPPMPARSRPLLTEVRTTPEPSLFSPRPRDGVFYARDNQAIGAALAPGASFYKQVLFARESALPGIPELIAEPPPAAFSNNHLGYAITWFGLALALAGFYIALLRRKLKS